MVIYCKTCRKIHKTTYKEFSCPISNTHDAKLYSEGDNRAEIKVLLNGKSYIDIEELTAQEILKVKKILNIGGNIWKIEKQVT